MLVDGLFASYLVVCNALLQLPGHRFRIAVLRGLVRASVGDGCAIERGVRVMTRGGLRIGDGTNVNRDVLLDARGGLTIGRRVNISPEVALLSAEHDPQSSTFAGRVGPIVIGDAVWIAQRAMVLPGTELGEGAVVAAGAVACGRIPARTIVAGNPALPIALRDPAAQETLERYRRFLH